MLKNSKILYRVKKVHVPEQTEGENFDYIFKNTRVLDAFLLNLIAQFSKKIHIFLSMGGVLTLPSPLQDPSYARACTILYIFITQKIMF